MNNSNNQDFRNFYEGTEMKEMFAEAASNDSNILIINLYDCNIGSISF